ncbi:ATP-binding protein [Streptomyces montanisoli]|uniref:ATP-binding protein n=1 Tax=Streptomyces montanisoli TaxID=2798581 RepID=A0A940RU46_9ACTN|nr:ATP-binding protein [Streptomyces montanisoli]MBP0457567.1 ATP-binding protein [Streptomyces montanisoli]
MNHHDTRLATDHTARPTRQFTVLLSSTRRGARLARLLAVQQLIDWDTPFEAAAQVVAELASNAALHGRVAGRDFRLTLTLRDRPDDVLGDARALRIAVTDARGESRPHPAPAPAGVPDAESGRGLLLVASYADRWGVQDGPGPCKTVWAELDSPAPTGG